MKRRLEKQKTPAQPHWYTADSSAGTGAIAVDENQGKHVAVEAPTSSVLDHRRLDEALTAIQQAGLADTVPENGFNSVEPENHVALGADDVTTKGLPSEVQQRLPTVIKQPGDPNGLIDATVLEVQRCGSILRHLMRRGQQHAYEFLARLYCLSMRAASDRELWEILTNRAQITLYKTTGHHLGVIRAVVAIADEDFAKQTVQDWSTVLWAWEIERVEPTREAVYQWGAKLAAAQPNSSRMPPLYATAKAIVQLEMEEIRKDEGKRRRERESAEWHRFCLQRGADPIAKADLQGQGVSPGRVKLLLAVVDNQHATILGEVGKDEKTIRALWRKYRV